MDGDRLATRLRAEDRRVVERRAGVERSRRLWRHAGGWRWGFDRRWAEILERFYLPSSSMSRSRPRSREEARAGRLPDRPLLLRGGNGGDGQVD
jgi:hypothetical protein